MEIEIINGDITTAKVDAIVNAANENLSWGSGVCGAIFRESKHPYELQKECSKLSRCKTGSAVITNGYELSKYIIHAVGPIYYDGCDENLLKGAYLESLRLAEEYKINTIAFPAISTGIYGYPIDKAAKLVCSTLLNYKSTNIEKCYVYLYDQESFDIFNNEYKKQSNSSFNKKNELYIKDNYSLAVVSSFKQIPFLSDVYKIYKEVLEVCGLYCEFEDFQKEFKEVVNDVYLRLNGRYEFIINANDINLKNQDIKCLSESDRSLVLLTIRFTLIIMLKKYNIIMPICFDILYFCILLEFEDCLLDFFKENFVDNTIFAEEDSKEFLESKGIVKNVKFYSF